MELGEIMFRARFVACLASIQMALKKGANLAKLKVLMRVNHPGKSTWLKKGFDVLNKKELCT